jgi:hypothetical protein
MLANTWSWPVTGWELGTKKQPNPQVTMWLYRPTRTKRTSLKLQSSWEGSHSDKWCDIQNPENPGSRMMTVHLDRLAHYQGTPREEQLLGGSSSSALRMNTVVYEWEKEQLAGRRWKQRPREGRKVDTPLGYSGRTALRREYVTCQRIARQRLDKRPAIRPRNNRTNVFSSLLGNRQHPNGLARWLSRVLFQCGLRHVTIVGLCFLCMVRAERIWENTGMGIDFAWVPKFQRKSIVARRRIRSLSVWY